MNNPTTEEIVKSLKICASSGDIEECLNCIGCGETVCATALLYAAAERLDLLEAELAAVKERQRWRPATELPKEDGQYLATCRSFGGRWTRILGFAKVGEDVDDYDLGGKRNVWYDYDSEYGYGDVHSVTHWMPLPEAPKEESE